MKRNVKKVVGTAMCGVLVAELALCNGQSVEAKKVSKQESVYVTAGADGSTDQITVSDWLKDSGAFSGKLTDTTDLTDIKNVKGDETFTQDGGSVQWDTSDKDIYYQGKSNKELPVGLTLTYTLDGKKMTAEEMLGKNGDLEIHVKYTNQAKQKANINGKQEEIYTPFVMVTGMILSSDHFSDIEIDNGRVINDGSNNIVVGMGVPGLTESLQLEDDFAKDIPEDFTVKAKVTDFEMSNTFTFASSSLLNDVDLGDSKDLDELEDKLDDLTDAATKLTDGTDALADNLDLFHDKMGELQSSVKKYNNQGVKKVAEGTDTLAKNGKKMVSGVNSYADGVTSLAKGAKAYVDGAQKIAGGNTKLYEAVKDMPSQINQFDEGLLAYTGAVDKMGTKENVTKLKDGTKALSSGITTVNAGLGELEKSYSYNTQVIDGLDGMVAQIDQLIQLYTAKGDTDTVTYLTGIKNGIETASTSLDQVTTKQKAAVSQLKQGTDETSQLKTGADAVASGVATVMDGLSTLSGKSSELTKASATLKSSVPTLVSSAKQLKEGSETLTKNNKTLTNGANKLTKASKTMKKSAKQLNQGMKTLNQGAQSLETATVKLIKGIGQLDSASGKLENGASKLDTGMKKFNNKGIKKIKKTYDQDVKKTLDRLDAVLDAGKDYKSFSGLGTDMDGEVKFIIETKAVEKED